MKGTIAIIGSGMIGNVAAREILCREHPEIIIVESVEDIPKETFPVKNFDIEPLIISERYAFDSDFRKNKKSKNQDWQRRIKDLQRRT